MNIQIFGTKKSFDTKKAQRFFKERRIKFQFVDLAEKGMSKGELTSVMQAVGGIEALVDPDAHDQDTVALITYLAESQKFDKLWRTSRCCASPSCATVARRPWATSPTSGRPGSSLRLIALRRDRAACGTSAPRPALGERCLRCARRAACCADGRRGARRLPFAAGFRVRFAERGQLAYTSPREDRPHYI